MARVLFRLAIQMLKFHPASKDRFFYDKYEYGICISLPESGVLRAKTLPELERAISWRNSNRYNWDAREVIKGAVKDNLMSMFNELELVRDQIKIIISFSIMYIYCNDAKVLQHLADLPYVHFNSAVQAVVDRPRDVVLITNPKFRYRSYFKEKLLEEHERDRLLNFLESRRDIFRVTNTLKSTLNRFRVHWLPRHLFVEHNDPKDITMLSLVMPGIIRKTVSVQAK